MKVKIIAIAAISTIINALPINAQNFQHFQRFYLKNCTPDKYADTWFGSSYRKSELRTVMIVDLLDNNKLGVFVSTKEKSNIPVMYRVKQVSPRTVGGLKFQAYEVYNEKKNRVGGLLFKESNNGGKIAVFTDVGRTVTCTKPRSS